MGTLKAELGTKEAPGGVSDPPKFNYEFTDYRLEVSKALHPKDALADFIAVMAETGAVPVGDNVHVLSDADVPEYEVGDEVILFLRSLADEDNYDDDIGRPVPDGFDNDDYFIVMVGQDYGKIVNVGDGWHDSRSGKGLTVKGIEDAVENMHGK